MRVVNGLGENRFLPVGCVGVRFSFRSERPPPALDPGRGGVVVERRIAVRLIVCVGGQRSCFVAEVFTGLQGLEEGFDETRDARAPLFCDGFRPTV
jgi:hypothetical protein